MICLGIILVISNVMIGLAQLDDIVPMIMVGRVLGGIGAGMYTYFFFMYIHSRLVCTHTFSSCTYTQGWYVHILLLHVHTLKVGMYTYFYFMYILGWYVHSARIYLIHLRFVCIYNRYFYFIYIY